VSWQVVAIPRKKPARHSFRKIAIGDQVLAIDNANRDIVNIDLIPGRR